MSRSIFWGNVRRNSVRKVAAAAVAALILLFAGSIPSARAACPDEGLVPGQLSTQAARDAIACLINEQRASSGLGPLTVNFNLQQAAQPHSRAMNKHNFFGHGSSLNRVKAAGYLGGVSAWRVGEVIGWGKGRIGTPRSIVSSWMGSPSHRSTMLMPGYRELGVGVAKGSPVARGRRLNTAIYTVDFGYRG